MNIACIGGGPAGLYLGILLKRRAPQHDVVIYERNRPHDTFGFGVVFSDATLGNLATADPDSHAEITSRFARWDDIEVHVGGEVLRSTGHGFCGIERRALLAILQARAHALGVRVVFEREIRALDDLAVGGRPPDVIVACDGVASWVREALAAELQPSVDVRPNKFVWLGCTVPYQAFTFVFKPTPHGLFRVHAYRYHEHGSTFIVECREDTWRSAGLDTADEDATVEILARIFADELAGHRLIKNRSIWRNFPTVRCQKWHAGNVVLMGDAAHTAHFSIGSGTKLAMEDAIALADELLAAPGRDIEAALASYEARRRPEVEALQAAAQASLAWFEGTERYARMAPVQFTYSLMTRSLRVSHASVSRRDPHLARGVEQLLATTAGVTGDPPPPTALPVMLGDRRAPSRIAVAPFGVIDPAAALGAAARAGAGLVVTGALALTGDASRGPAIGPAGPPPGLTSDDDATAWRVVSDEVHAAGALIVARLAVCVIDDLAAAVQRAERAGFDALLLDPGESGPRDSGPRDSGPREPGPLDSGPREPGPREPGAADLGLGAPVPGEPGATAGNARWPDWLPAMVAAARAAWPRGRWLAAAVGDRTAPPSAVAGFAAQLVRAGCDLLWVSALDSAGGDGARLAAAPLADRLRNELGVATAIACGDALLPDLDAAIAAGRADLVAVDRLPDGARRSS